MNPLTAWLRFLAVAIAYGITFFVVRRAFPFSVESAWFVCLAMVCFLGLVSMARPIIRIRMPPALRRIRAWETGRGFYRAIGVPSFGRLLRRPPLRLLNTYVYLAPGARETPGLDAALEAGEASHFWAAVLVLPYMVHAAFDGAWGALWWVSLTQLLVNAYPIMHLRLARGRLERLTARRGPERGGVRRDLPGRTLSRHS